MIVTGGDSVYFPLIGELVRSIAVAAGGSKPPIGVIDAGLTPTQVAELAADGAEVVQPRDMAGFPVEPLRARPALAANLAKPWLDRLFPGHDTLLWLDADTWVQDFAAVRLMLEAAADGALAVVPGSGASRYSERSISVRWLLGGIGGICQVRSFNFKNGWHAGLSRAVLRDIGIRPLLSAGVFALRADAPHWKAMRRWQSRILARGKPFTSDQLAMALAVHRDGLPVELLPDTCNYGGPWRVDLARSAVIEWYYPRDPVGIIHLVAQKRMRFDPTATVPVAGVDGQIHALNLRFGHFHRMAQVLQKIAVPVNS
jgi:hypothetical protein